MDLTLALRAFVRTVERGSMTAAARDLAISQPAVSKHLRNLEAHVGARLLERSARLVRTTPQGRRLYEASHPALATIDAALEDSKTEAGSIEGRLRLHAPSCIGSKHLHPIITAFQTAHPRVAVDLILENRSVDIVYEDYDLALRYGRPTGQDIIVRQLGFAQRVLVAAPACLDRIGALSEPEQLAGVDMITTISALLAKDVLSLQKGSETINVAVRPVLRTNNAEVLVSALREGHGVGVVQQLLVADDLAAGRLLPVLTGYGIRATEAFLAYPSVKYMRPVIRAFTDFAVPRIRAIDGISQTV